MTRATAAANGTTDNARADSRVLLARALSIVTAPNLSPDARSGCSVSPGITASLRKICRLSTARAWPQPPLSVEQRETFHSRLQRSNTHPCKARPSPDRPHFSPFPARAKDSQLVRNPPLRQPLLCPRPGPVRRQEKRAN